MALKAAWDDSSQKEKQDALRSGSLKDAVDDLEKKMISEAYEIYKSTYKVAEVLQTSQSTIVRKMRQLGISADE